LPLAGVDTALIVVNAQTGVELMTERMMRYAADRKLCRMIVINKIDADNLDLPGLVADIRDRFGKQCMLLDLPAHGAADVVEVLENDAGDADFESVAAAHRALIDQIVEEDGPAGAVSGRRCRSQRGRPACPIREGVARRPPDSDFIHLGQNRRWHQGTAACARFAGAESGEGNPPPFYKGEPGDVTEPFHAAPDADKHVLAHVFKVVADPTWARLAFSAFIRAR
jgi:elongation factor G